MTIFYRETIICYLTHIVLIYSDHRFALKNSQIESRFSIATKDILHVETADHISRYQSIPFSKIILKRCTYVFPDLHTFCINCTYKQKQFCLQTCPKCREGFIGRAYGFEETLR